MVGGELVAVLTPHFDIPFRFLRGSAVVVEQDSAEDIENCAETILRTPEGFRVQDGMVDFGISPPEFENQPIDIEAIKDAIVDQEPRVSVLITTEMDKIDNLIAHVFVELRPLAS